MRKFQLVDDESILKKLKNRNDNDGYYHIENAVRIFKQHPGQYRLAICYEGDLFLGALCFRDDPVMVTICSIGSAQPHEGIGRSLISMLPKKKITVLSEHQALDFYHKLKFSYDDNYELKTLKLVQLVKYPD